MTLLKKLKEKKLVDGVTLALSQIIGPALPLDAIFDSLQGTIFPAKKSAPKPPPHAQIAALGCTTSSLGRVAQVWRTSKKQRQKTNIEQIVIIEQLRFLWLIE